ncbi:hypothetical protein V6O07_23855 [Arthrospira platensis SPKY2]
MFEDYISQEENSQDTNDLDYNKILAESLDDIFDKLYIDNELKIKLNNSGIFKEAKENIIDILDLININKKGKKDDYPFLKSCNPNGYITGRFIEDIKLRDLPVADFFKVSKKAYPFNEKLNVDVKNFYQEYENGVLPVLTGNFYIQQAVGLAYNIYTTAQYELIFFINKYSRLYKIEPDINIILEKLYYSNDNKKKEVTKSLYERYLLVRYLCYILYEDRTLSGYKEQYWPFWGRLLGVSSPSCLSDKSYFLSEQDALSARSSINLMINDFSLENFRKSINNFVKIWKTTNIDNKLSENLVRIIGRNYILITVYNGIESGVLNIDEILSQKRNKEEEIFLNGIINTSLIIGALRRIGTGSLISKVSSNKLLSIKDIINVSISEVLEHKRVLEGIINKKIYIDNDYINSLIEDNYKKARKRVLSEIILDRINYTKDSEYYILNLLSSFNPEKDLIELNNIGRWFEGCIKINAERVRLKRKAYLNYLIVNNSNDPDLNRTFRSLSIYSKIQ